MTSPWNSAWAQRHNTPFPDWVTNLQVSLGTTDNGETSVVIRDLNTQWGKKVPVDQLFTHASTMFITMMLSQTMSVRDERLSLALLNALGPSVRTEEDVGFLPNALHSTLFICSSGPIFAHAAHVLGGHMNRSCWNALRAGPKLNDILSTLLPHVPLQAVQEILCVRRDKFNLPSMAVLDEVFARLSPNDQTTVAHAMAQCPEPPFWTTAGVSPHWTAWVQHAQISQALTTPQRPAAPPKM